MSWLAGSSDDATAGAAGEIRLLHVEDDEAFADLAATFLERDDRGAPIDVVTETDPRDAVDRIDDVDCVVSDHDMPGMDGLDLLELAREDHPDLPFVLLTGRGSEEIASEAIGAGVTDYLRKDGSSDQFAVLANTVRNAVDRRRAREEAERGEQRLRRALDLLPQCVVVKNLDGEYLLVNESGAEMYGATPEELEGQNERDLLDTDVAERFREEDREVVASGEPLHIEEQHVVDDVGGERVERVTKIPYDAPGTDDPAVLVVAEDVTAASARRDRLDEATDRIEDALAALDSSNPDLDAVENALTAARDFTTGERSVYGGNAGDGA